VQQNLHYPRTAALNRLRKNTDISKAAMRVRIAHKHGGFQFALPSRTFRNAAAHMSSVISARAARRITASP